MQDDPDDLKDDPSNTLKDERDKLDNAPDDEPDDARLLGWRRLWLRTENPLFAWEAVRRCLDLHPPIPLPPWCNEYLAETAVQIHCVMSDNRISPEAARAKMLELLGFRGQGDKTISTYRSALTDMGDAAQVHLASKDQREAVKDRIKKRRNIPDKRVGKVLKGSRDLIGLPPGKAGRPRKK